MCSTFFLYSYQNAKLDRASKFHFIGSSIGLICWISIYIKYIKEDLYRLHYLFQLLFLYQDKEFLKEDGEEEKDDGRTNSCKTIFWITISDWFKQAFTGFVKTFPLL